MRYLAVLSGVRLVVSVGINQDVVGAVGVEPTTNGLKGRCSATELRPYYGFQPYYMKAICGTWTRGPFPGQAVRFGPRWNSSSVEGLTGFSHTAS